jgi:hypothetical protein
MSDKWKAPIDIRNIEKQVSDNIADIVDDILDSKNYNYRDNIVTKTLWNPLEADIVRSIMETILDQIRFDI